MRLGALRGWSRQVTRQVFNALIRSCDFCLLLWPSTQCLSLQKGFWVFFLQNLSAVLWEAISLEAETNLQVFKFAYFAFWLLLDLGPFLEEHKDVGG